MSKQGWCDEGKLEVKQEFKKIIKEIEAVEPDSNGRYNACQELLKEINKL